MEPWILILIGIIKLFIFVILGTAIGSILDYKGWTKYISFVLKPFLRFAKLPSICGTSFITAIFSNPAASAMLSGAKKDNHITRKEMIVTGVIDTFPTHISHLTKALFVLVPLIGYIGIVYYLIILLCDLVRTFIVLFYNRLTSNRTEFSESLQNSQPDISWQEVFIKTKKRVISIIKKLIVVFLPLYLIVIYLVHLGFFKSLHSYIPGILNKILSPEIISIAISKLAGLTASATVANSLLSNSRVVPIQILIALLIGNMVTIPFNTIKRNLPSTIAIFPGKDGFWIVLITEGIRFILNFLVVIILFVIWC